MADEKIILVDGEVLYRYDKAAISLDCCRGCCCKEGFIDRSFKYKGACESAGGIWAPCPPADVCSCECTAVLNVNDVEVLPGTPNDFNTFTRVGTESIQTKINGSDAQWKFAAATRTECIVPNPTVSAPVVLATVQISVQLWLGPPFANVTGFDMGGWAGFAFSWLFESACFDDEPNSWPCAKSVPYYASEVEGIGPDIAADVESFFSLQPAGFSPASPDWADEFRELVEKYLVRPEVTLDCVFHPPCGEEAGE